MFICPPRLHILSLGLLNKLCSTRYRFFNFTSCKISQTCAQSDFFTWLMFNWLTLLQSSLSLCSWPAYGDQFQFPGWPSGSVFGSLSLSCSLWLSQELSGSRVFARLTRRLLSPRSVTFCWSRFVFVIPRQLVFDSLRLYWQVRYRSPF